MKNRILFFLTISIILFSGCSVFQSSPITKEPRTVTPMQKQTLTVNIANIVTWHDKQPPSLTLSIPTGVYVLEAEDSDYLYFLSTKPLLYQVYNEKGVRVDSIDMVGGLYFGKKDKHLAGVYQYVNESKRILVWKLNNDFYNIEGKAWFRNWGVN